MYLFRIEVKCFSRILCLPKLLEFPHISSLILSRHQLFCAILFCNHLSLIRALLLSPSLSLSYSLYLSFLLSLSIFLHCLMKSLTFTIFRLMSEQLYVDTGPNILMDLEPPPHLPILSLLPTPFHPIH